jgi:hypothetical protein
VAEACRSDEELHAWIGGELEAASDALLERHVAACEACTRRLQSLARIDEVMRTAAATLSPPRRRMLGGRNSLPGAFAVAAALIVGLRLPSPWHAEPVGEAGGTIEICAEPETATCTSPIEPSVPDDALATFPDDEELAPRGLCISADEWHEPVCVDGEILAG